jgi:hypothetical protein
MIWPQALYKRSEIPIADYLMSHQQALKDEFLAGFNSLEHAIQTRGIDNLDRRKFGIPLEHTEQQIQTKVVGTNEFKPNVSSWKSVGFRYERHDDLVNTSYTVSKEDGQRYPTAYKLIQEYGIHCPIANYSCMAPNTKLNRHTGPENRTGKYIRIHIPLIIPAGDIFLEVNGIYTDWSDLFGFNNQLAHSAHNYSNEYRLVFLIDIDREHIGMPPGTPYNPLYEKNAIPFIRVVK